MTPGYTPTMNLLRNPSSPFLSNSVLYLSTNNGGQFVNTGARAKVSVFNLLSPGNFTAILVSTTDEMTGNARLILGAGTGIYTQVDENSVFDAGIGTAVPTSGFRGGNLQINQFISGAAQPSAAAAQAAGALFYGSGDDFGAMRSSANTLSSGEIAWSQDPRALTPTVGDFNNLTQLNRDVAIGFARVGDVATDQTGTGAFYQYVWGARTGTNTGFFRVTGSYDPTGGSDVSRTFGLLQAGDDPDAGVGQWPSGDITFTVNPINGDQAVIGSQAGRVFATVTQGIYWLEIGNPASLDSTQIRALTYGAPEPTDPTGATNDFIYAGTQGGGIYVTFTGGGAAGNQWTNLSAGLDGSPVVSIITNPTRGSHEAYAVTAGNAGTLPHVYHMVNARAANPVWTDITGNLNQLDFFAFNDFALTGAAQLNHHQLSTVVADWRYVIPNAGNPAATHPALYVAGYGGVWRSLDNGATWTLFPSVGVNGALRPAASCRT